MTKLSEKAGSSLYALDPSVCLTFVLVYSCPFNDFETLRDFLDAVKILSLDFNITWKFGTHQDDIMADKAKLLDEVEELLHRTNGEAHLMDEQAGKRFQFSVRNPFAKNDLRRIDFDRFRASWLLSLSFSSILMPCSEAASPRFPPRRFRPSANRDG